MFCPLVKGSTPVFSEQTYTLQRCFVKHLWLLVFLGTQKQILWEIFSLTFAE